MKTCSFPGCENYTEGRTEFCASHNAHFRKEKRQAAKNALKKPARIPKFSEKKATKILPYAVMRRIYLKENPVCEANLNSCETHSAEIHHKSMSDLDYLEVKTWMAVCRSCHNFIEQIMGAEERRERGFLIDPINTKFIEPHKI